VLESEEPNLVLPVTKSTLLVIVCTTNVCAVIVPVAVIEPEVVKDPDTTWLPTKLFEPVVAKVLFNAV